MDNSENITPNSDRAASVERALKIGENIYTLRVQRYKYAVPVVDIGINGGGYELVLKSFIEVLEQPFNSDAAIVVGMLSEYGVNGPKFVKMQDMRLDDLRLTFIGDEGFMRAKNALASFTDAEILQALDRDILGGGILNTYILKICIRDPFRNTWMCIFETEPLKLFSPPSRYTHENYNFVIASRMVEGSITYCAYIPAKEGGSDEV